MCAISVTLFLLGIITVSLLTLIVQKQRRRMSILKSNGIPGPAPHLIWGNLREYLATPNVLWDTNLINTYGPVCGYYLGAKPVILIADPELIDIIQTKRGNDFLDRPRRVPGGINPDPKRSKMLGNLNVTDWQKLRIVLGKGFSPARLRQMWGDAQNLIQIFLSCIALDKDVDFYLLYQNLTLDLIFKAGFGLDSNILQDRVRGNRLKAAVEQEFSKSTSSFILKLFLCCPEIHFVFQPIRVWIERAKRCFNFGGGGHSSELWKLAEELVQARTAHHHSSSDDSEPELDLLHVMLASGTKLSEDSAVANSVLFFEAGFETLSASLAFTTHLLIQHPDVQKEVRNEIREVLGETDGKVCSIGKLSEFPLLDAVIRESLRMYPPQTTFIGRSGTQDLPHTYEWKNIKLSCVIPKNVHVQVGLYQVLNSEDNWEEPRSFMPRRHFIDNSSELAAPETREPGGEEGINAKRRKEIVNQPFGRGKRMCVGKKYADMVLKMVFIQLLSDYKLTTSSKTEDETEIKLIYKTATMTPRNGVWSKVERDPLF